MYISLESADSCRKQYLCHLFRARSKPLACFIVSLTCCVDVYQSYLHIWMLKFTPSYLQNHLRLFDVEASGSFGVVTGVCLLSLYEDDLLHWGLHVTPFVWHHTQLKEEVLFLSLFVRVLLSPPKDRWCVVQPSVFPTHQMNSLELSGKSHLILISFPRLSHSSSPLLCRSTWSPPPLFSLPSASQFYLSFLTLPIVLFFNSLSLFIAIFLLLLAPPIPTH